MLNLTHAALLSAVSRQMQKEASDVVYSAKNTFFVPLGSINRDGWWCIPRPFPQVKRLDIAFDMQDVEENSAYTLALVKSWRDRPDRTPGTTPFEELTDAERWDLLHEDKKGALTFDVWPSKTKACMEINNLDLLRVDLTSCRCLVGCCRMGPILLEFLDIDHDEDYRYPKRIEIVGILEREQDACRDALAQYGQVPLDRVFFVDNPGCICNVSPSICHISSQITNMALRKKE